MILFSNSKPAPASFGSMRELDLGELAGAAGLLLVGVVDLGRLADRLAVGDLRRADGDVDVVRGAAEDIDLDVEVELAHPLDDGLAGLLVGRDAEGRVLAGELRERHAELLLVGLGCGSTAISMTGAGNSIFSRITGFSGSQSVSPVRVNFRPTKATMSPAIGFIDLLAGIGMHQHHAADALFPVLGRVQERHPLLDRAGIDAAKVRMPNGSSMILKASIASGSSSDEARVISAPVLTSMPLVGGTSTGDGR